MYFITYFFPKEYVLRLSCKYMYIDFVLFKGDIVFYTTCFFNYQNQFRAYPYSLFYMHLHIYEYIQKHKVLFLYMYLYIYITYVYVIFRCNVCVVQLNFLNSICMCGRHFIYLCITISQFLNRCILLCSTFLFHLFLMDEYVNFLQFCCCKQ